jgi:hypothetical protein
VKIPYVIDNRKYKLLDILNAILKNHQGQSMDVVTAYFKIQGYNLLKKGLSALGIFRLAVRRLALGCLVNPYRGLP